MKLSTTYNNSGNEFLDKQNFFLNPHISCGLSCASVELPSPVNVI